ncbi:MAG: restriction endonuclease subunit S [Treponema phagedenis]|uniref:restriction endonuclease subunit S n=1 Tax=Treponema phagedenis TaxID=162 RepID=UPI00313419BC
MSKIDELLKNEKVEWKELGEVVKILDSQRKPISKDKREAGNYPYYGANGILDYVNDYIFDGVFLLMGEDGSVINKDKSPVLHWAEGKIWVNNHAHVLAENKEIVLLRFVYFFLTTTDVSTIVRGTPPKINQQSLRSIQIPIPSLETQEKIVKILDQFTNYVTELQVKLRTELQARTKQYNYYRDMLLSEEYLNKLSEKIDLLEDKKEIVWDTIGNICTRQKGINITAGKMKELHKDGAPVRIFAGGSTFADIEIKDIGEENIIRKNSIIVKSRGNIDFEFYEKEFSHKNEMWSYSSKDDKELNIKFLYYYLKNNVKYFRDNAITGKLPQISIGVTDNYKIPKPHIFVQNQIVKVLDKFQELLTNTTGLLPEEISKRQKQYEYYRERLLTFNSKSDNTHTHTHTHIL